MSLHCKKMPLFIKYNKINRQIKKYTAFSIGTGKFRFYTFEENNLERYL